MRSQLESAFKAMFDKLEAWLRMLITNLPNIVVAIIVLILTIVIARLIRKWIRRWFRRTPAGESISNLIGSIGAIVTIVAGMFLILSILNLDGAAAGLLAGASISGLVIGLALQSTFANTFAGIVLSIRNDIRIGDWIEVKGVSGEVKRINLRNTVVVGADNNTVFIPNREVLDNPVKNFQQTALTRVLVEGGVAYTSDLDHVRSILLDVIAKEFPAIPDHITDVIYTSFGSNAITFSVRFWIEDSYKGGAIVAKSHAIELIKKTFDQEGILIPINLTQLGSEQKVQEKPVDKP